jgi:hypothetical protein
MDTVGQTEPQSNPPLVYEETPIIEPVVEQSGTIADASFHGPSVSHLSESETQSNSWFPGQIIAKIFGFILLFLLGIGLSVLLRQYLPVNTPATTDIIPTEEPVKITPTITEIPSDPLSSWKMYSVISGITRLPVESVSYRLPSDVLPPLCDGTTCASQGTYLPGGTRFTVALRGQDQILSDYRGKIVSDRSGKPFSVKQVTVSGKNATEFSGTFTGSTAGGYAFSHMRGVMIEISSTLSLEVNHFVPSGIASNFASDDTLFDTILSTFQF